MRIQMIKNKYKLPFNPRKPIRFMWDGIHIEASIITIYFVVEIGANIPYASKYYYSIAKVNDADRYFTIRHMHRKMYHNDDKLRPEREFGSYNEAKDRIDKQISGWKEDKYNQSEILVDIIDLREKEKL